MRDFLGQELAVGDSVVHAKTGPYGGLSGPYRIEGFTTVFVLLASARRQKGRPENCVKVCIERMESYANQ